MQCTTQKKLAQNVPITPTFELQYQKLVTKVSRLFISENTKIKFSKWCIIVLQLAVRSSVPHICKANGAGVPGRRPYSLTKVWS